MLPNICLYITIFVLEKALDISNAIINHVIVNSLIIEKMKVCDTMSIGKRDTSASMEQRKPRELQFAGFSIPFWQGGLSLRLVAFYSSLSNHLQM